MYSVGVAMLCKYVQFHSVCVCVCVGLCMA